MENINIDEILNKWFDMKFSTYDKLERNDSIYLYYGGEKYADIRIDKRNKLIYYKWGIYKEFSEIIPLQYLEFEEFMINWVEDTFGLREFSPDIYASQGLDDLKIPNYKQN